MRSEGSGLTLVEVLVGLALLALVAVAVSQAVFGTLAASDCERDRTELTQAAQRALQRMAEFTRETDEVFEPKADEPVGAKLKVKDVIQQPGDDVEFYWEADEGLLKENGAWGTVILAEEVSSFVVRYTDSPATQPLITIELSLCRGDVTVSLATAVVPRHDAAWAVAPGP